MSDTIFALSSGAPPAAIALIRISGPEAGSTLIALTGRLPEERRASLMTLRSSDGAFLDEAVVLWFAGQATATGEDLAELHCHGGRAVVAAVEAELNEFKGLRLAQPGEFTRRSFANGRIDLAEAEGLADLLSAETELQRRAAIGMASGAFSKTVEEWRDRVLALSAQVEAALDFSDEDDVATMPEDFAAHVHQLKQELDQWLTRPRSERLKDGYRVVLAGPPNSGKSTLFNALVESEAAITSPIAGTTRDVIERSVAMGGVPFTFVDTAGLHDTTTDEIEKAGIGKARIELEMADRVLWLGPENHGPEGSWELEGRIDEPDHMQKMAPVSRFSAVSGDGMDMLKSMLIDDARGVMPKPGEFALNQRQYQLICDAAKSLGQAATTLDPLLIGEGLRHARAEFDRLIGRSTTETMLDALFGRFCIGK